MISNATDVTQIFWDHEDLNQFQNVTILNDTIIGIVKILNSIPNKGNDPRENICPKNID